MVARVVVNTGDRYSKLVVLEEVAPHIYPNGSPRRKFLCKCDCGNEVKIVINTLRGNDAAKGCGCSSKTHGLCSHRLYQTWCGMHTRCYNRNADVYAEYGGRGIRICRRWHRKNPNGLQNFIDDMFPTFEEGLTLDRSNNATGYNRHNCQWETMSEQAFNTRPRRGCTSSYRGVYWNPKLEKWAASATVRGRKQQNLGVYDDEEKAAEAFDHYVMLHDPNDTDRLNFKWI